MNDLEEIIQAIVKFRDERDWARFHDTKNLAAAVSIEAAELNELFLWKSAAESDAFPKQRIREELADVLVYSLLLAHKHEFNVKQMILDKMKVNAEKYPIEKAKGNSKKYNEL